MRFVIDQVILWPRNTAYDVQILPFATDKINVVHGRSGTGKSSLIAIIDYCLGATRCAIPVGVIRDSVSWFGLLVRVRGEPVLICRRTPVEGRPGKEFLFLDGCTELPKEVEPNCSLSEFKNLLNTLVHMTNLPLGQNEVIGQFDGRPSYRDLAAFNFLPQHIVANPNTLFYKADTYEHRERLKRLMPFALGIIDNQYAANERERYQLQREAEQLRRQWESYETALKPLTAEVRQLWLDAVELGMLDGEAPDVERCVEAFNHLSTLLAAGRLEERFGPPDYAHTNERYRKVLEDEERLQKGVDEKRRTVRGLELLSSRGNSFRKAVVRERASVINLDWLKSAVRPNNRCVACGSESDQLGAVIDRLSEHVSRTDELTAALVDNPIVDREIEDAKRQLALLANDLHLVRKQRLHLEKVDGLARTSLSQVYLLLGQMKATVATFTKAGTVGRQQARLSVIEQRLRELDEYFTTSGRAQRERSIDLKLSELITSYASEFGLERRGQIELDKTELTLRFRREGARPEYLWEVGSGANWMGYHLSAFFALHQFLSPLSDDTSPVFSFLVIDQPSQVYFPSAASGANELDKSTEALTEFLANAERNHDVTATRRIFEMLEVARERAHGQYQILVLEHADTSIWGSLPNTVEAANWKAEGTGLIPAHWLV